MKHARPAFVGVLVSSCLLLCAAPSWALSFGDFIPKLSLGTVLELLTPIALVVMGRWIKTPKDHERAAYLAELAESIAHALMIENRSATAQQLIAWLVERLRAFKITSNDGVLQRVAALAVAKVSARQAATASATR